DGGRMTKELSGAAKTYITQGTSVMVDTNGVTSAVYGGDGGVTEVYVVLSLNGRTVQSNTVTFDVYGGPGGEDPGNGGEDPGNGDGDPDNGEDPGNSGEDPDNGEDPGSDPTPQYPSQPP